MRPFSDVAGQTAGSAQVVNGNPLATANRPRGKRTGPLAPFVARKGNPCWDRLPWKVVWRRTGIKVASTTTRRQARELAQRYSDDNAARKVFCN